MKNFENKKKIIYVSGALKIACGVVLLYNGALLLFSVISSMHAAAPHRMDPGLSLSLIPYLTFEVMMWWNLLIFFSRSQNGHIFDAPTVRRLTMAGQWSLVAWTYMIIIGFVREPPPHDYLWFLKHPSPLGPIAIIFTAWLLREGQTLEEEQKLTV